MTKQKWLKRTMSFILTAMIIFSVSAVSVFAEEVKKITIGAEGSTVELAPGTYSVPVSLKNAGNITNPSMAAGCLAENGKIIVNNDGTVTVYLTMATLDMMGKIYGNATKLSYYKDHNTKSELIEATVESTRMGFVTPNFGAGPKEEVEVPEVFSFKMPYINQNGIYIQVFVDAMNMNPDAYVLFDYANVKEIVDTTKLETLIAECEQIKQNNYAEDTFNALTAALAEAKELVASPDKTNAKVDEMLKKLSNAKDALVLKDADYTAVDEAIKSIPTDKSKYTEESVKKLEDAVAAVNRNLKIDKQSEVDEMALAIKNAIKGLKEKQSAGKEVSPQTGNSENIVLLSLLLVSAGYVTIRIIEKRKVFSK